MTVKCHLISAWWIHDNYLANFNIKYTIVKKRWTLDYYKTLKDSKFTMPTTEDNGSSNLCDDHETTSQVFLQSIKNEKEGKVLSQVQNFERACTV